MIKNLESTLRSNAMPKATQFIPTPATISAPLQTKPAGSSDSKKQEEEKEREVSVDLLGGGGIMHRCRI
uniref:Uncharacterized protein n=1 Tax=Leersia perrieri TaxID=77586 RepID=A0A0D9VIW8_9ORYZ